MSSRMRGSAVRVRAFAKINLSLRVLGVRSDGYHELRTTFQSLALHDTLTFTRTPGPLTIDCRDPDVPRDESNLIWRAADRLWRERAKGARGRSSSMSGVRVRLIKRIPTQAGLAGGSSDAAATLRALARLWRMRVSGAVLSSIARELGADVPYFLTGGTALGAERGDRIQPLDDRPPAWVVIARPAFGVSTADAFKWWDEMAARGANVTNDLEPPVVARHPQIGRLIAALRTQGAREAAMSGSGSAVFGLFDAERAARRAADAVRSASVSVFLTKTLDRARFQRLSAARRL
jgi:4-diphosphocytidyl-2-C-methyl-D-erythritol kinase